jgi:hypothetical protein
MIEIAKRRSKRAAARLSSSGTEVQPRVLDGRLLTAAPLLSRLERQL